MIHFLSCFSTCEHTRKAIHLLNQESGMKRSITDAAESAAWPALWWTGFSGMANKKILLISCCFVLLWIFQGCDQGAAEQRTNKTDEYVRPIPGIDENIPAEVAEKGKVLISYSDCYTCHKVNERSVGPSFKDIAKRYPANQVYIEMLARKVINGGSRSWGYPVMAPHPALALEDAQMMTAYILTLED